ncbi:MAG: DNA mismatch repair protein MutL, partial [Chlamydiae bacterium]|nr:DNA mismatch repair protein MutL [Chlamydiota bacterium]
MPGKIHLLSDLTINQIAAGEVIESSASIVKELVDNAIDAGATEITVETQGGGRALIRVSDDGCGMESDDLLLSVERHATSKMTKSEDLFSLPTLGFRGEALPSIASVSKMVISSALKSGSEGTALFLRGSQMEKTCAVSRRPGTTVEVRSLFFN